MDYESIEKFDFRNVGYGQKVFMSSQHEKCIKNPEYFLLRKRRINAFFS